MEAFCKAIVDKHGFDVHLKDNDLWKALHHFPRNGSYEFVSFFADKGADIHLKIINGHLNRCKTLVDKHDFDVHLKYNDGWTALHHSAQSGSYKLFSFFGDMGADIYVKTNSGWICLNIAAVHGHLNICKALVDKHGFDVHLKHNDGWTALHHCVRSGNYDLVD